MSRRDRRLLLSCLSVALWMTLLMTGWGPTAVAWLALGMALVLFPWRESVTGPPEGGAGSDAH